MLTGIIDSGQKIITNGLVLHLDAAQLRSYPTTGTTWTDLSGNGNNGTLTNGPTFDSGNGGSIVFDGTNDYVDMGSTFKFNNINITYEFWFKVTDNINSYRDIIMQASSDQSNYLSVVKARSGLFNGSVYMGFQGNNVVSNLTGSQILNIVVNYTAVLSLESGFYKMYLYRNGILENQLTTSISSYNMNSWPNFQTRIGGGTSTYPEPFKGDIYIGRGYNRALSATEVLQNYNATKSRFGL